MDRNHIVGIILLVIVICCIPFWAWTKTAAGVGEYEFGMDITENQSCQKAKIKAEADAIQRAFGSNVGTHDWQMCDNNTCDFNSVSWSDSFGQITEIQNESVVLLNNPRRCRVTLVADVQEIKSISPTFDIDVQLNRSTYKSEDEMTINLIPSEPMYIAVFNWSQGYDVTLIELKKITGQTMLPEGDDIRWLVRSEQDASSKEMIFVIASKKQIGFLANYPTDKFKKIIQQLLIAGNQVKKISYTVTP